MHFQRDPCQERTRIGTSEELCVCGAEYGSHYNGACPGQSRPYVCDAFLATSSDPKTCHICRQPKSAHKEES